MMADPTCEKAAGWELQAEILHDLRTPLSVVSLQAQLLRRATNATADGTARALAMRVDRIERAVAQMAGMLDQLQDIRWSHAAPPVLRRERADIVALMRRIADERAEQAPEHHLSVVAAEPVLYGSWDAGRIERAISNLLGNAVKYSPGGGEIAVTICRERSVDGDYAVIRVCDNGIGIPEADLPHIFRRYYRAGNVVGRFCGAGLGLASVQAIVAQHGGTLTVDSREGYGTTFVARLPVDLPDEGGESELWNM